MLDRIGKWSVKRKILIFCALPLVTWLVIGIVVFLLGVPFSAVDYYTAIVFSLPGVLGIVVIILPDPFAEIFLRVRVLFWLIVNDRVKL